MATWAGAGARLYFRTLAGVQSWDPIKGVQVVVLGDGNTVVLKSIKLGRDFGDSVEVTAGLALDDKVIDSPPETLQNGDPVRLAVPKTN